jgi:D-sedoheptulose 7-phosphate isomerase
MTMTATDLLAECFAYRRQVGGALIAQADAVASACQAMAERFSRGGTLLVFGSGTGATDAAHIAVEFLHPVIVGKRALPAIALTGDVASLTATAARDPARVFAEPLRLHARPDDIALGVSGGGPDPAVAEALRTAGELGLLTVALAGEESVDAEHVLRVPSDDPLVLKEVHVTMYHVLWELVHVFLEQAGTGR